MKELKELNNKEKATYVFISNSEVYKRSRLSSNKKAKEIAKQNHEHSKELFHNKKYDELAKFYHMNLSH